jgi:L-glyceraldehyde 3-phosphate reductase
MKIFKELKTPFVLNQPSYSMLNRWVEEDKLDEYAAQEGFGLAVFSPLYQGFLTDRYLHSVPTNSRVGKGMTWIGQQLTEGMVKKLNALNEVAKERGQKLSQMALSWVLRNGRVTTVLIGASKPEQIIENTEAAYFSQFTAQELEVIETILKTEY